MRGMLDDLHLMSPSDRPRFNPQPKPSSRLQERTEKQPIAVVDERAFKQAVWTRDKGRCRKCGRKVVKTLKRQPDRAEVHHIHGRAGELRFEERAALLLCLSDHERVSGKVAEKWIIEPAGITGTFQLQTAKRGLITCLDARLPVTFKRVV